MHTASDLPRRSGNKTRWLRTCVNILLYAHQSRRDWGGANPVQIATRPVCIEQYISTDSKPERCVS